MRVHTSHRPYGYPPLHYAHGNKHIGTHDVVCDIFAAIMQDVGFHMGRKQLHVLFSNMFNSSHWQVDIVLNKDDIYTLVNVVVVDPKWTDLFPWSCTTQRFVTFDVVQEQNYCDWHPADQFLPLVVEVFRCLHKQVDVFLHNCANAIWSLKGLKGLCSFYLGYFSLILKKKS
jgi:hypothetical protein